jgi:hypothetical protein
MLLWAVCHHLHVRGVFTRADAVWCYEGKERDIQKGGKQRHEKETMENWMDWTGVGVGKTQKKLCRIVGMAVYLPTLCFSVCRVATAASTTYLLPLALVRYLGQE